MSARQPIVLDANILIRAVFGTRVRDILKRHEEPIAFCTPDVCFDEARKHIPAVALTRRADPSRGLAVLDRISLLVQSVDASLYEEFEADARALLRARDIKDWPVAATSMKLQCPVWTEDRDFFGIGLATWTTANIEFFLRKVAPTV